MIRAAILVSLVVCAPFVVACSSSDHPSKDAGPAATAGASGGGNLAADGGGSRAHDAAIDAGGSAPSDAATNAASSLADAGAFFVPDLPHPITPGTPITTPEKQWAYVPFDDAFCANGSTTGIAVNRVANAQGLVIFLQGGGACWDDQTCLVSNTSVHLHEDVKESIVLPEAMKIGIFDRSNAASPYKDFGYVYSAYCTGDLHSGTQVHTYTGSSGPVDIHHVGANNIDAYLKRLVATFPDVTHVLVTGISAGGYGSTFNWWRIQGAFPNARVDVLDDAGLIVDAGDDRIATMSSVWGMALPPGCTDCGTHFSAWLPFYATRLTAPRRYGLTGFLHDQTIGQYFALDGTMLEAELLSLRKNAGANQKTFFLNAPNHSVFAEGAGMTASDGATIISWYVLFATDDPKWDHAGP